MTKIEWNSMKSTNKDMLVADKLFGGYDFSGKNEVEPGTGISMYGLWAHFPGKKNRQIVPQYTADRNACTLILDEIDKHLLESVYLSHLMDTLFGPNCWLFDFTLDLPALMLVHDADPDDICYAAVKAIEEENAKSDS